MSFNRTGATWWLATFALLLAPVAGTAVAQQLPEQERERDLQEERDDEWHDEEREDELIEPREDELREPHEDEMHEPREDEMREPREDEMQQDEWERERPVAPREEEEEVEEEEHGFENPEEAAETFLQGLKDKDVDTVRKTVSPDEQEEFDRVGSTMIEAITVTEYEILNVEVEEEEDRAHVEYRWETEIDKEMMLEAYTEMIRESLREEGVSEEEIEELLDVERDALREELDQQMTQLEQPENRMLLEREEGRWYVTSAVDDEADLLEPEEWEEREEREEKEEEEEDEWDWEFEERDELDDVEEREEFEYEEQHELE